MVEPGPFVVTVAQAVVLARCPLYRHEVPHVPLHMLPNRRVRRAQANSATGQGRVGQDRTGQDSTHAYALALLHPPRNKSTWPLLAAQAAAMPRYQDPLPPRSSSPPPITPIHAPFLHTRASPLHPSVAAHAPLPCPKLPSPSPSPLPYSASPVPVVPGALSQIASDRCAQADYPAIALHTCCFHPWALERSCLTKPGLHASATRIMPL